MNIFPAKFLKRIMLKVILFSLINIGCIYFFDTKVFLYACTPYFILSIYVWIDKGYVYAWNTTDSSFVKLLTFHVVEEININSDTKIWTREIIAAAIIRKNEILKFAKNDPDIKHVFAA
jgi:hypothetical protein